MSEDPLATFRQNRGARQQSGDKLLLSGLQVPLWESLLTMRIHLRYRKGILSIGLIVLLLILWQFLWFRWATLW
jgi:hypothetical protein